MPNKTTNLNLTVYNASEASTVRFEEFWKSLCLKETAGLDLSALEIIDKELGAYKLLYGPLAPTTTLIGKNGQLYIETTTPKLYQYKGSEWKEFKVEVDLSGYRKAADQDVIDATKADKDYVDTQLATKQGVISDLDTIRSGAGAGSTAVQPDTMTSAIAVETDRATEVESELSTRIENLESRGRYLSTWDATTGKPDTEPTVTNYELRSGDYYLVGKVGTTNYQPDYVLVDEKPCYVKGHASTTQYTGELSVGDTYIFDLGSKNWTLVHDSEKKVNWGKIGGDLENQTDLKAALDNKVDKVTGKQLSTNDYTTDEKNKLAGIQASAKKVEGNVEVSSETPALTSIDIGGNKYKISVGIAEAKFKDITGEPTENTKLAAALNAKQDKITDLDTIKAGAALGATAVQPETGKGLFSGNYNDLTNKPTNISHFINDAGYLTEHQSLVDYRKKADQDIIDAGKQDKLIAGENITISDDNVISAIGGVAQFTELEAKKLKWATAKGGIGYNIYEGEETFDGSLEGKDIAILEFMGWAKLSTDIPTKESIIGKELKLVDEGEEQTITITEEEIQETDDYIVVNDGYVIITKHDNVVLMDMYTFEEAGIYFFKQGSSAYVSSFTYDDKILTWNGDITGKKLVIGMGYIAVHISDNVPDMTNINNKFECHLHNVEGSEISEYVYNLDIDDFDHEEGSDLYLNEEFAAIALNDVTYQGSTIKKGISVIYMSQGSQVYYYVKKFKYDFVAAQKISDEFLNLPVPSYTEDDAGKYLKVDNWGNEIEWADVSLDNATCTGTFTLKRWSSSTYPYLNISPTTNIQFGKVELNDTDGTTRVALSTANNGTVTANYLSDGNNSKLISEIISGGSADNKMDKVNPVGTGSFSLNRDSSVTVGEYSFAEGYSTAASGDYSHAEGKDTVANGSSSHAEGYKTKANGIYSHAEGDYTVASGASSHTEGTSTIAIGQATHAEGIGGGTFSISVSSISENVLIMSSPAHGIVPGLILSHIENDVNKYYEVEWVYDDVKVRLDSTPAIQDTNSWCLIQGIAYASYSHAEGYYTTASGYASHAEGYYTTAIGYGQHVVGRNNIIDYDLAEIVGNGSEAAKSNARTLDWSGNEVLSGSLTTTKVNIGTAELTEAKINKISDIDSKASAADLTAEVTARTNADSALNTRINNLESRGRFLSSWDCATGLPTTDPTDSPYTYKAGDYYIVSNLGTGTKYKPSGSTYTKGVASTVEETGDVKLNDYYNYDGTNWILISNTGKAVTFASIEGNVSDNAALVTEFNKKQDKLPTYPNFDVNKKYILGLQPNADKTAYELCWVEDVMVREGE